MAILTLGTQTDLINKDSEFPISLQDSGNRLVIEGVGAFTKTELLKTVGNRAKPAVKQVSVITAATASQITVVAPSVPTDVVIEVEFKATNTELEFTRFNETYGKKQRYYLVAKSGETAGTILAKLSDAIKADVEDEHNQKFTATPDPTTEGATTLTSLTLTGRNGNISFTMKALDKDGNASDVVTVLNPSVTAVAFEGLNTYEQLRTVRLATDVTTAPHGQEGLQLPEKNAKYTSLYVELARTVDYLQGHGIASAEVKQKTRHLFYFNEGVDSTWLTTILNFFVKDQPSGATYSLVKANGSEASGLDEDAKIADFIA